MKKYRGPASCRAGRRDGGKTEVAPSWARKHAAGTGARWPQGGRGVAGRPGRGVARRPGRASTPCAAGAAFGRALPRPGMQECSKPALTSKDNTGNRHRRFHREVPRASEDREPASGTCQYPPSRQPCHNPGRSTSLTPTGLAATARGKPEFAAVFGVS